MIWLTVERSSGWSVSHLWPYGRPGTFDRMNTNEHSGMVAKCGAVPWGTGALRYAVLLGADSGRHCRRCEGLEVRRA